MRRIERLLVANRGEIARRVFRTCRELGIPTVAVFSDPDRGEPFVAEADEAVGLGGASSVESYLRIEALLEAAARQAPPLKAVLEDGAKHSSPAVRWTAERLMAVGGLPAQVKPEPGR